MKFLSVSFRGGSVNDCVLLCADDAGCVHREREREREREMRKRARETKTETQRGSF